MSANLNFEPTSTRPYLIRALHEWCTDNGLTPYVTVAVDASVQVPMEYVKDDEIVLNIGYEATTALRMGNDYLEFKARFSGAVRDIMIPVDQVIAIFARENGQGMAFPKPERAAPSKKPAARPAVSLAAVADDASRSKEPATDRSGAPAAAPPPRKPTKPSKPGKPALTRVK